MYTYIHTYTVNPWLSGTQVSNRSRLGSDCSIRVFCLKCTFY